MNVHGLRRNVKNVVRNYSDAQVKVREATSNDPWGPPSTLMGEIADLSYNVVAFTEIMQMIWKRLNDHGKNWRHVYKALVLLEYLIKTGSEKVGQQCRENIFAIQTLKDFQHTEDNKDQGVNVREKSKQLVALLKDDERLRAERLRALKAKERFAQATAARGGTEAAKYGTSSRRDSYNSDAASPRGEGDGAAGGGGLSSELECARPQTAGEEELQLQLALAMSKEEAEQEERLRKHDDLRLQMALTESQHTTSSLHNGASSSSGAGGAGPSHQAAASGLDDLLGLNLGGAAGAAGVPVGADPPASTDPWGMPVYDGAQAAASDPWSSPTSSRPNPTGEANNDPWQSPTAKLANHGGDPWASSSSQDPWRSSATTNGNDLDEFDVLSKRSAATSPISGPLVGGAASVSPAPNPFASPLTAPSPPGLMTSPAGAAASNPFQATKPPTINELRLQNSAFPPVSPVAAVPVAVATLTPQGPPPPRCGFIPTAAVAQQNPFL